MFRRCLRCLCEHIDEDAAISHNMSYQVACGVFGYKLNDHLEKTEIRKRFKKLALQYHPDHGGTDSQFKSIMEAQKILIAARHDKGRDRKVPYKCYKDSYEESMDTPGRQAVSRDAEYRTFTLWDFVWFVVLFMAGVSVYLIHAWNSQEHLTRSRHRLVEEKMDDPLLHMRGRDWHPWTGTLEQRDMVDEVAVLQGSMSPEALELKKLLKKTGTGTLATN